MANFTINFIYPYVLLLFIPAIALSLWPYFRTPKKYRRTRNRVTSLVLHLCIMTFTILALSGITFSYDKVNTENELILLVDASFSNRESETNKNEFVREVIEQSDNMNKVGVVTFGFDQVYAVELTNDTDGAYNAYINAPKPDTSATDIASALNYARSLFTNPATAKIVLLSDGAETDGDALTTIRTVAASGIRVDTVYFSNTYNQDEMQLINVAWPDSNIAVNDEFDLTVSVQSSYKEKATLRCYDNNELVATKEISVDEGVFNIVIEKCSFSVPGLHKMRFELECSSDTLDDNNTYYSYYYIESFDNLLIVASNTADATNLKNLLEEEEYNVTVVDVRDTTTLPMTLDEIREYDEVIMFNVANSDMPEGFVNVLHTYVSELGGGMLTVGGNDVVDGEVVPHAYNRKDMYGTLYQEMLPVEVINYTPPLGLMIIVDCSGSMNSFLDDAKNGARSALYTLSERDYVGIMVLADSYSVEQNLIPATNQNTLINIIESLSSGGGTNYSNSIEFAGRALATANVQNRHIILISDGQPGDAFSKYSEIIAANYRNGITFSMFTVGSSPSNLTELNAACEIGGGKHYYLANEKMSLGDALREDLTQDDIKEYYPEPFIPEIISYTSVVSGITGSMINPPLDENGDPTGTPLTLGGFYGTKNKNISGMAVENPLWATYAPLYSQWQYGNGRVGSFMSDLYGTEGSWSSEFMSHEVGKKLILNMINALFPKESIRYRDFNVNIAEDNYTTKVSIMTEMTEGDNITVEMTGPISDDDTAPDSQRITRNDKEEFSRYSIVNKLPGVYMIYVTKTNADGVIISEYTTYKAFSYSKEYDMFIDEKACSDLMDSIAEIGRGAVITDPLEVFEGFVERLTVVIDPRMVFLILTIVLFLLDIAVRKFKWKWPHELVREHKEKKQQENAKQ